eukprot:scaffold14989_cov113-Isochrysis_galbana.AAC.3
MRPRSTARPPAPAFGTPHADRPPPRARPIRGVRRVGMRRTGPRPRGMRRGRLRGGKPLPPRRGRPFDCHPQLSPPPPRACRLSFPLGHRSPLAPLRPATPRSTVLFSGPRQRRGGSGNATRSSRRRHLARCELEMPPKHDARFGCERRPACNLVERGGGRPKHVDEVDSLRRAHRHTCSKGEAGAPAACKTASPQPSLLSTCAVCPCGSSPCEPHPLADASRPGSAPLPLPPPVHAPAAGDARVASNRLLAANSFGRSSNNSRPALASTRVTTVATPVAAGTPQSPPEAEAPPPQVSGRSEITLASEPPSPPPLPE